MEPLEVLEMVQKQESSSVQFKEQINNINQLSQEFVAFANTGGGVMLIGVSDKGEIKGITADQIHKLNQWISNAASQHVKPPISPITEIVTIENKNVLVVKIPVGYAKPYYTNEGIAYVKVGSDKRIAPPEEILRLFQSAGKIYADESVIAGATFNDIDTEQLKLFLRNKFSIKFQNIQRDEALNLSLDNVLQIIDPAISLHQLLENMKLAEGGALTLAGLLLIGKRPQQFRPLYSIKCVAFLGNDISGTEFRDKEELLDGSLHDQFEQSMAFVTRNLRKVQVEKDFNSLGSLEIPGPVLAEIIVNALVHRDYYINSSIQILLFDNRIEIISPGKLPNTLSENNIRYFTSIARNPILYSNCIFAGLPFTGIGSGIPRAISLHPNIQLKNDVANERFIVTLIRPA